MHPYTNKLEQNSSEDISKETKMAFQNTIIYQDVELPKNSESDQSDYEEINDDDLKSEYSQDSK